MSSCQKPITWGAFMKYNENHGKDIPSTKLMRHYFFTLNRHLWIHNLYIFFLHMIPAYIVDTLARLTGQKPM